MILLEGQVFTFERRFTLDDVESFARISGDRGIHHVRPDREGKIMLQGLLTATLPTKIGGDLNYIAREMDFEFLRPVFVGDTVTARAVVEKVVESNKGLNVKMSVVCKNQDGRDVLVGWTDGLIRRENL